MADIIDACNALVSLVRSTVYPSGTGNAPIAGNKVHVFPGWPVAGNLDADIAAGNVNISVFPNGVVKNTTRFAQGSWQTVTAPVTSLTTTLAANNNQMTIGGTVSTPQNIGIVAAGGTPATALGFAYAVQANDTLTTIATALAALVAAKFPGVTSSGPVITAPAGIRFMNAAVGGVASAVNEVRRQKRQVVITIWAPSQPTRDTIAPVIDIALAQLPWITLLDGSGCRLIYEGERVIDTAEKATLYRRDLIYWVEYPTLATASIPQIVVMTETIGGGVDTTYPVIQTFSQ
jgi:hypothetical protein